MAGQREMRAGLEGIGAARRTGTIGMVPPGMDGPGFVINPAQNIRTRARANATEAYNKRMALTKSRFKNAGIGTGVFLGANEMSNGRSKTAANQNTFATRRMRRQNVGISSGALQTFDTYSRSIGGY
jgi:hypothetical protein